MKLFIAAMLIIAGIVQVSAQSKGGILTGAVQDQYRKPLIGAQITVTNQETKQVYKAEIDKAGKYKLEVPAGIYTVTAELLGFNPKKVSDVKVGEGQSKLVLPMMLPRNFDGDFVTGAGRRG